jgi:type III pantothenate kinase
MNLAVDIGNTNVKTGVFNKNELVSSMVFQKKELKKKLTEILTLKNINNIIVSSVLESRPSILNKAFPERNILFLNHNTPLPIINRYKTKTTLGYDRIAVSVGAYSMFNRNNNVLVVDAGTCIKYDFVNKKGEYMGGAISPGIEMRFKALHEFTDKLPKINKKEGNIKLSGNSTESSILSGVINGTIEEVKGIINNYRSKYLALKVVITGGDSEVFDKAVKNTIFADRNLALKGLNTILNYNIETS